MSIKEPHLTPFKIHFKIRNFILMFYSFKTNRKLHDSKPLYSLYASLSRTLCERARHARLIYVKFKYAFLIYTMFKFSIINEPRI